jgi:glycosyltransferase involved in cell wall biosynthesis
MRRIAILASHPIQYFVHLYRQLTDHPEFRIKAFYACRLGTQNFYDPDFGRVINWGKDLLEGYEHEFLTDQPPDNPPSPLRIAQSIQARLDTFRPDAVCVPGYASSLAWSATLWCRRRGIPTLLYGDSNANLEPQKPWLSQTCKHIFLPTFFSTISGFLTQSDANEAFYRLYGVPAGKMHRVPMLLPDPEIFAPATQAAQRHRWQFRATHAIPKEAVVCLFVGKLITSKRPMDILHALHHLRRTSNMPQIWALYVGDGNLRRPLEEATRHLGISNALFMGFQNLRELPACLSAADMLVHPCAQEKYGMVLAEAASMGLPIIAHAHAGAVGTTAVARPGVNALTRTTSDTKVLAEDISRLAQDESLRSRMGEQSLRIIEAMRGQFTSGFTSAVDAVTKRR